jgi:hypothetical protein
MSKILIGADPEVFVKNPKTGKFLSAHDIIPGTKRQPFKHSKGMCQVDGVAMEFNVSPSPNATRFVKSIRDNLSFLSSRLASINESLVISCSPIATFPIDYFDKLPPYVKEMGCEPDFDAYTGVCNAPPTTDLPFRAGGGHIHVGWCEGVHPQDTGHLMSCVDIVRQLDVALYIPSFIFDADTKRRTLYGNPGSFRPKSYGCEYRVLSNRWVKSPLLQRWVFNTTNKAVKDYISGKKYYDIINEETINFFRTYGHTKKAKDVVYDLAKHHPKILSLPKAV